MKIVTSPEPIDTFGQPSIFLAGSIEQGKAEDWQKKVARWLEDHDVTLLNPRRSQWDATWKQTPDNPLFKEQVVWELTALEEADVILIYFQPETMSPVSLLELGLHIDLNARVGDVRVVVCCPEGFWRRGNVQITCERYGIPVFDDLQEAVDGALELLSTL